MEIRNLIGKNAEVEHQEMTLKGKGTKTYKGNILSFQDNILKLDNKEINLSNITNINYYEGDQETYNQIHITRDNIFKTVIYF